MHIPKPGDITTYRGKRFRVRSVHREGNETTIDHDQIVDDEIDEEYDDPVVRRVEEAGRKVYGSKEHQRWLRGLDRFKF